MNDAAAYGALGGRKFDVVAQFMAFTPTQMARDIEVFSGNTGQYIFISSASVYEKPPRHYVITEETPAINPYWPYSQNKIACEELVRGAGNLNWTIVRPSHTVRSGMPTMVNEGDIIPQRMLQGKPVIVAGDGATPWTLTRSEDFAKPFVGLLGNGRALGEIFHITSDRGHTWDEIYRAIGRGLGVEAKIVHVPTDTLIRYKADWDGPLLGDKTWTALFDNSKVKRVAGDVTCVTDIDGILEQSIRYFRKRQAEKGPVTSDLEPLYDRIVSEQAALGA
jgi:nucleoside-diphosphate-sugar epimerase